MTETADASGYLTNPEKWQACSHPELADRKPEELFEAEFAERYRRLHQDLWWRIIRLHGTLYTLEQLKEFPFDYLYAPNGMQFWQLVAANFLDIACLELHGLVGDSGVDVLSLCSFRDALMSKPWLCQDKRDLLAQTLRGRKFDETVRAIAERVKAIRDSRIAHRLIDRQSARPKDVLAPVSLEELKRLFDAVHSLFGALSFGSAYVTLAGDLTPSTVHGKPTRTCLDDVLDGVLRDSDFVNQPERNPWWGNVRKHKDAATLHVMNELRKRIGLPEA